MKNEMILLELSNFVIQYHVCGVDEGKCYF